MPAPHIQHVAFMHSPLNAQRPPAPATTSTSPAGFSGDRARLDFCYAGDRSCAAVSIPPGLAIWYPVLAVVLLSFVVGGRLRRLERRCAGDRRRPPTSCSVDGDRTVWNLFSCWRVGRGWGGGCFLSFCFWWSCNLCTLHGRMWWTCLVFFSAWFYFEILFSKVCGCCLRRWRVVCFLRFEQCCAEILCMQECGMGIVCRNDWSFWSWRCLWLVYSSYRT